MDRLFKHLPFMFTYLDDHSHTLEEHYDHLRQFLYHPSGERPTDQPCEVHVCSLGRGVPV
jgi:hypothetical protein